LIRVLTPVTSDGLTDPHRKVLYVGEAQLLTAAGPLPLSFEIEAASLGEAAERFGTGAKAAVERAMRSFRRFGGKPPPPSSFRAAISSDSAGRAQAPEAARSSFRSGSGVRYTLTPDAREVGHV